MSANVNSERNPLAGTWKLKPFEVRATINEVTYPFGRDAKGYLIMTPDGYWSVALMSANRLQFSSGAVLGGTAQEKVSAAESYLSYAGRYDIQGNKVVVRAEVSFWWCKSLALVVCGYAGARLGHAAQLKPYTS